MRHARASYRWLPVAVLLAGCSSGQERQPQPVAQGMAHVLAALDTAGSVRFPMVRSGSVLPAELERPMSWHWQGPLDRAVRIMATRLNYTAIVPPANKVPLVNIDRSNSTAAGLLDELAAASDEQARIDVDVIHHTIQITWISGVASASRP